MCHWTSAWPPGSLWLPAGLERPTVSWAFDPLLGSLHSAESSLPFPIELQDIEFWGTGRSSVTGLRVGVRMERRGCVI